MPSQSTVRTSVSVMCHAASLQKQIYKHLVEASGVLSVLTNRYDCVLYTLESASFLLPFIVTLCLQILHVRLTS